MKRCLMAILIFAVSILFLFAPEKNVAYAAEPSNVPPLIAMSASTSGQEVIVDAVLENNTGILGMTVEIIYDDAAMTLINVERGEALSSLEYLTTNPDTPDGYSVRPFKINWQGEQNDMSTGTLFRMRFLTKETAKDGEYTITLRRDGTRPVTYLDGKSVESKNVMIDGVKIKIKGNIPQTIDPAGEKEANIALIVSLSVVGAAVVAAVVVIIIVKKKGKRTWKKLQ